MIYFISFTHQNYCNDCVGIRDDFFFMLLQSLINLGGGEFNFFLYFLCNPFCLRKLFLGLSLAISLQLSGGLFRLV